MPDLSKLDENSRNVQQARIIMIAALARLLDTNNQTIETVLGYMLSSHMPNWKIIIEELKKSEDDNGDPALISQRLNIAFRMVVVLYSEILSREMQFIKLFWQSA